MLNDPAQAPAATRSDLPTLTLVTCAEDAVAAYAAVELARTLGASLRAACLVPSVRVASLAQVEVRYDLVEAEQRDALEHADVAAKALVREAQAVGIAAEALAISKEEPVCDETLTDLLRLSDLVVVPQPQPGVPRATDEAFEDLLTESGRPCLIIPYAGRPRIPFRTVTVAWDGSAPAARALADSLPLLRRAEVVDVVRVAKDFAPDGARLAARVTAYLAAHGIEARFRTLVSSTPFSDTILSHMADTGSDLLVMGAYGHSRLREALVGGASRGILASMTVPVLMSH
ncbi:universal stress protein [Aquabacter cavernae]|uniref:universal stress protein n=1 Tax=Aquabacter cavernae TaxID=2496029 RepID=UPI000F8DB090|nr:universal stress protein [Aquabacter cavernae]